MNNPIIMLALISSFIILYLLLFSHALKLRESLQQMVLEIIKNEATSDDAKKMALKCFLVSGHDFFLFSYVKWYLTKPSNFSSLPSPKFQENELSELIHPILKKAIQVNFFISPIQYILLSSLMMAVGLYRNILCGAPRPKVIRVKASMEKAIISHPGYAQAA